MRDVQKTSPLLHVKALGGDDAPGTFEAIVSVFGNEDSDGEAVPLGAFTDTLKGPPPPITYSHQWMELPIGKTLEAEELDRAALSRLLPDGVPDDVQGGLYAKAKLHVDGEFAIDRAKAAYRNLLEGSLREFSWSGRATEVRIEERDGKNPLVWLEKIDMYEWGPCLRGANPATGLIGVKEARALLLPAPVEPVKPTRPAPPKRGGDNSGGRYLAIAGIRPEEDIS
jgi:HK97 family phage prohead protease